MTYPDSKGLSVLNHLFDKIVSECVDGGVMRDLNQPQTKSKLKLLEAAERLIAERGFEGVSVRDVTQAAKANVAAVNYHFGSREGMMGLVMTRVLGPIQQERSARLEVLEKKWGSKAMPLEELVDAMLRPLMVLAKRSEWTDERQGALVGRVLSLPVEQLPEALEESLKEFTGRVLKAMAKCIPHLDKEDLAWRLHFVMGAVVQVLVAPGSLQRLTQGVSGAPGSELLLARLMHFAVAGLREGQKEESPARKKGPQAMFDF